MGTGTNWQNPVGSKPHRIDIRDEKAAEKGGGEVKGGVII